MKSALAKYLPAAVQPLLGVRETETNDNHHFISADVQQLRDSQRDTSVTVLASPTTSRAQLRNDIAAITDAPETIESVGTNTLRATVPEHAVDNICSLSALKSIDLERDAAQ